MLKLRNSRETTEFYFQKAKEAIEKINCTTNAISTIARMEKSSNVNTHAKNVIEELQTEKILFKGFVLIHKICQAVIKNHSLRSVDRDIESA